ncbi:KH domain-containing protein HEN4-like protein [Tanacetum coccineum]
MQNYSMHGMGKTVSELHAMLKLHEQTQPKQNAFALHVIRAGKVQKKKIKQKLQFHARGKNQRKGKNKRAYDPKPKISPPLKKKNPAKDSIYHQCRDIVQGLRGSRKLKPGALSLYVGNGQRAAVEAIGTYHLCLPSGLVIVLNNFHYAPSITRGIILVSRLYDYGYVNCFVDNTIQISRNNMVYFSAVPRDGIFEIDLSNHNAIDSSMYAVSNKRAKLNLDSALLWHCHLGHISKKRIEKLQHDGLLNSTGLRAFEKCVLCMSRKMAQKPYTHQVKRAKDLLGLIHTDHKHEVFETFKVFQKEVENQLGKTIKLLHSDRKGEYMSQEFLDHLKDHEIIAHRTPPYTPQHNGYQKETMGYSFYYPPENKVLVVRNAEFLENGLITQEVSGSLEDLEIIQEEDTHHSIDTSLNQEDDDQEIDEPQSDIIPIRRLKQASRQWNKRSDDEIKKFGFTQNRDEPCVYSKASGSNVTFLILYVDDILIMGNNIPMLQDVKSYLGRCFAMKDLGEVAYIFGIKIYKDRSRRLIGLCQSAYIENILKKFHMENSKRGSIPMQEKLRLGKSQGASTPAQLKRMQNVPYASVVDSIMYAVRCTRPDVTFAQNITSRFQQNPELRVSCYTDAGYLTDADDLKSQTRYVFILNGGVVDWKSIKQSIFATSSAEAEYIAAYDASKEAVWVRKFIYRLGVVPTIEEPINMYCDNTRAITIANESGITKGARHIYAKVHYLREVIEYGDVKLEKVHTYDNLADPFTKALAFPKHSEHTRNIGMLPASSLM